VEITQCIQWGQVYTTIFLRLLSEQQIKLKTNIGALVSVLLFFQKYCCVDCLNVCITYPVYDTPGCKLWGLDSVVSVGRMRDEWWIGKYLEETSRFLLDALSRNLPGVTEEYHENPFSQDNRCRRRDSNREPPKYKKRALLLLMCFWPLFLCFWILSNTSRKGPRETHKIIG
jgi:hypothetical protein